MLLRYKFKNLFLILLVSGIAVVAMVGCGGNSSSSPASPTPTAPASAHVALTPASLDFGSVPVGVQKTSNVTLTNTGSTATVSQITAAGSGFSVTGAPPLPLVLSSGQSATVTVAFVPTLAGPASGSISVSLSGTTSAVTETVAGTGIASGQLVVSPSAMSFGSVVLGSSQNQTGLLIAGPSGITVSSASWTGTGYSVGGITFPLTVPAGQSIPFTVTFAPQASGSSAGSVSFISNATNSPGQETLSGSGLQPAHRVGLSWNPSASSVVGYNVYRGTQTGGPYTRMNASIQPGTTYSDANVLSGATYFYVVTAVDSASQESVFSNETAAVIPTP